MNAIRAPLGVFLILLGSYAFFWHSRDWNVSSRLMLTYALCDRGTVSINGLEDHTRDRARVGDRYYSDKLPGFSLLAVPSYLAARLLPGVEPHPLDRQGQGFTHWWADYWVTLGTSGLLSALCGALLTAIALRWGAPAGTAALLGLAYGLATPAYVYATLSYGHQATAFFLLLGFALIEGMHRSDFSFVRSSAIGLSVAMAPLVELQVAPASMVLIVYWLFRVLRSAHRLRSIAGFVLGASGPALILILYNVVAFGSPFDMGYFHEDLQQFQNVHSQENRLGIRRPDWSLVDDLLWSEHRGLLVFAPPLILAPLGWVMLAWRKRWAILMVSLGLCLAVGLVNLAYPEWTGGWSTGPRLLLPMIPFAMLPIAALLAERSRAVVFMLAFLTMVGLAEMTLFQSVGGRIPPTIAGDASTLPYAHPLREVVWPMVKDGRRFDRNLISISLDREVKDLSPGARWVQFGPLVLMQMAGVAVLMIVLRPIRKATPPAQATDANLSAAASSS